MKELWWLEYAIYVMSAIVSFVLGIQIFLLSQAVKENNEGERNEEKKCYDKSSGFLAGLLVGWFFF
jgi:hypothetical protein